MIDLKAARLLDQNDPLKTFKNRFTHQENEIYLDGNSLGKLPKSVLSKLEDTLQNQWGKQGKGCENKTKHHKHPSLNKRKNTPSVSTGRFAISRHHVHRHVFCAHVSPSP